MQRKEIKMKSTFFALLIILFLFSTVQAADQKENACVKCHTDKGTLKSLFGPYRIDPQEGMG